MFFSRKLVATAIISAILPFSASFAAKLTTAKVPVLTLDDAIMLAVRMNPDIRSDKIGRISQRFQLKAAYYAFQPQFKVTGATTYNNGSSGGVDSKSMTNNITPSVSYTTHYGTNYTINASNNYNYASGGGTKEAYGPQVGLTIKQPLLKGFGRQIVDASLNQSIIGDEQNKLSIKSTIMSEVTQVISSYFSVVQEKRQIDIQKESIKNYQTELDQYNLKIKIGQMAPSEANEMKSNLYQAQLTLVQDQNQYQQSLQSLLLNLGVSPDTKIKLATQDIDVSKYDVPTIDKAYKQALITNPEYQTDVLSLANDRISLMTAKDNARWQLDLSATAAVGSTNAPQDVNGITGLTNGSNEQRQVMLNLTIPIDDMTLKAGIVSARVSLAQQQIAFQQFKWQLKTNLINDLNNIENDKRQIDLAEKSVIYARKTLEDTKTKISVGQSSTFELTSQANDLTSVERTLVDDRIQFYNDYANLDRDMGTTLRTWKLNVIL